MHHRSSLALALALALVGTLFNLPDQAVEAAPSRPDIVLFYTDDNAPYPKRLWADEQRTPNLARFAERGLEFRNARASTPMCGPARAALLTGQYGHNNGVTANDIKKYEQRGSLSPRLRKQGYKTAFVGKYINRLADEYPTRARMSTLSNDWSQFDVTWENQGRFYNYRQYRKPRTLHFGSAPEDHSSYVAGKRAAYHVRTTKRDKPLFLVVSLYDGHDPLQPMRRFEGHPACADIEGWAGPAYDEADVSDKPAWVRAHPRLDRPSYDLRDRCESLMTVDWVVGQVRQALKDSERLGNALLILTADNGWMQGDHRLEGKLASYSTPVPLYMRWPRVLQSRKRIVMEPVSNVDLAPTICELAGCVMPQADGLSLVPLIKNKRARLGRKYIYTEMLHADVFYGWRPTGRPAWAGVESTRAYDDTLWAYARYRTGEEELYNVSTDRHRLVNRARQPGYWRVLRDMRGFWRQVWDGDDVWWRSKLKPKGR